MDKVYLYSNAGIWGAAIEPTDSNVGQVYPASNDPITGASFGTSFGSTLYSLTGRPIGLVPCAKGGSSMDEWMRAGPDPDEYLRGDTLYGGMILRAFEAAELGNLKGLIFYQGESDVFTPELIAAWADKFTQWCADVRENIGVPDLPIIMTVIGPDPHSVDFPYWTEMITLQETMVLPPNCVRVYATDLTTRPDDEGVHLDTAGLVILGRRYAHAFVDDLGV